MKGSLNQEFWGSDLGLVPVRFCTGSVRVLYGICSGSVRGLYGDCTGTVRGLYQDCTGTVRAWYGRVMKGVLAFRSVFWGLQNANT